MKRKRKSPASLKYEYSDSTGLTEASARKNPIDQFKLWFEKALKDDVLMANAMTLSTVGLKNEPLSRVVLLKEYGKRGFVFYTNYDSPKGRELKRVPKAGLLFYWPSHERQVRIQGKVKKVSAAESSRYFSSRPRPYQIGALTSDQSTVIPERGYLEQRYKEIEKKFRGKKISRPAHWGGYCVEPDLIEFWEGRASRLHDRLRYTKKNGKWKLERLAP